MWYGLVCHLGKLMLGWFPHRFGSLFLVGGDVFGIHFIGTNFGAEFSMNWILILKLLCDFLLFKYHLFKEVKC